MELTEKTKELLDKLLNIKELSGMDEATLIEVCVECCFEKYYHEPDLI